MSSISHRPMRLPPVRILRVRDPTQTGTNSCQVIMNSLLGAHTGGCVTLENSLRKCMDGPADPPPPNNNINYHLSRMHEHIVTAKRKKR